MAQIAGKQDISVWSLKGPQDPPIAKQVFLIVAHIYDKQEIHL